MSETIFRSSQNASSNTIGDEFARKYYVEIRRWLNCAGVYGRGDKILSKIYGISTISNIFEHVQRIVEN